MAEGVSVTRANTARLHGGRSDVQILGHAARAARASRHLHRNGPLAGRALLELRAANAVEHALFVACASLCAAASTAAVTATVTATIIAAAVAGRGR